VCSGEVDGPFGSVLAFEARRDCSRRALSHSDALNTGRNRGSMATPNFWRMNAASSSPRASPSSFKAASSISSLVIGGFPCECPDTPGLGDLKLARELPAFRTECAQERAGSEAPLLSAVGEGELEKGSGGREDAKETAEGWRHSSGSPSGA